LEEVLVLLACRSATTGSLLPAVIIFTKDAYMEEFLKPVLSSIVGVAAAL
jgi:hypothetical protein